MRGMHSRGSVAGRRKAKHRTAGRAAVHARDAVVAAAAVSFAGLQRHQREYPVLRRRLFGNGLLQIMVAGSDEHVQGIWCSCVGPFQSAGVGRLHEGRPVPLFDDQPPRRIVPGGPVSSRAAHRASALRPEGGGRSPLGKVRARQAARGTCAMPDAGAVATRGTSGHRLGPLPRTRRAATPCSRREA